MLRATSRPTTIITFSLKVRLRERLRRRRAKGRTSFRVNDAACRERHIAKLTGL